VDLEHIACEESFAKASRLLEKAVRSDEKQDFITAQRFYLLAIEYLIPAIQFEKDLTKKQEIREKAKTYMQRAEQIANMNRKQDQQSVSIHFYFIITIYIYYKNFIIILNNYKIQIIIEINYTLFLKSK